MTNQTHTPISTDVVYHSHNTFSIGDGIIEDIPAHWAIYFSRKNPNEEYWTWPYERCYTFITKPTSKQIRQARRNFRIKYSIYAGY